MSNYEDLQAEHQRLLAQSETAADPKTILAAAQAYIEHVKTEAEFIPDVRQRDQLRANLRYWASFVYDQTGAYPNTTLRPALQPSEEPGRHDEGGLSGRRLYLWGGALLGLIILGALGILLTRGLNTGGALPPPSEPPPAITEPPLSFTPIPSDNPAATQPLPTATRVPAGTLPPTVSPSSIVAATPTLAPGTTEMPTGGGTVPASTPTLPPDPTEIAASLLTQVARLTPTSPEEPLPGTGGETVDALHMASSLEASGGPAGKCGDRSLAVSIDQPELFSALDLVAQVELSQGGQVLATAELPINAGTVTLDLPDGSSDASLLAQVDQPVFLFDSVIVQFSADCRRDRQRLTYRPDFGSRVSQEMPSELQLRWRFLTWGPSLDGKEWIATLLLVASGGDGSYIFWAEGDAANAGEDGLLLDNRLLISKPFCDPAHLTVGVTSAGRTVQRQMILQAPTCIEAAPTPGH